MEKEEECRRVDYWLFVDSSVLSLVADIHHHDILINGKQDHCIGKVDRLVSVTKVFLRRLFRSDFNSE